uniref:Immunoglobulin domain-containing protein n=1 Tax=Anabas testudineus TaxID=64144 RepID=A0A3Q1I0N6_ANATE
MGITAVKKKDRWEPKNGLLILLIKDHLRDTMTEALSVTGEMGGKVSIKCSHANAFSNIKYFCKGECRSEDVLISSRDKKDLNSKYVISDEGNKFTVTISHLTKDDSGTYWCGIDRVGLDTYNKVVLTVIKGEMTQCYVCSVHEESFYDEDEKFHCTELISTQTANYTKRERFSLKYNKHQGVFIVTISALTQADAGRYQCAVKSSDDSNHCRTEMHLSILSEYGFAINCAEYTLTHPSVKLCCCLLDAVVIVGLSVFLCLGVCILVELVQISHPSLSSLQGNNGDHNYEEIQMWSQQASSGAALSSIYTMVSPHADQLHYASVTFQKDSVSFSIDGNTPPNQNKNDSSSRAQGGIQPPARGSTVKHI